MAGNMNLNLSVIIPIYNEEECIVPLYNELNQVLSKYGKTYEILFVDDGSKDHSYLIMKELHDHDPKVKIIKFRSNFGQSAAMKAGFDYAAGEIIVTMDGDLQNDPHDIPALIDRLKLEDYDVICGWRKNRNDPRLKRIFSKYANRLRAWMTGETIHDSGCTLRAYIHDSVQNLDLYGELHRYIPAMLLWRGYHVGEMITNHRERTLGRSKYNWKRLLKGFLDLLVVSFWQKYSARPMHIFGGTGLLLGAAGVVTLGYLLLLRVFYGTSLMDRPLFFGSFFLIVISIQFFAFGILADISMKVYHRKNDLKTYLVEKVI
jgi:glycosyltransferase involved in cell wall biosynthesis